MREATTTIAVKSDVLKLIEAIAKRRSEQLGFTVRKGDIVRNVVMKEAQLLGILPSSKPTGWVAKPGPVKARKDPSRPRRGER